MIEIDILIALILYKLLNANPAEKENLQNIMEYILNEEKPEEISKVETMLSNWFNFIQPKVDAWKAELNKKGIESIKTMKVYNVTDMSEKEFNDFLAPYLK